MFGYLRGVSVRGCVYGGCEMMMMIIIMAGDIKNTHTYIYLRAFTHTHTYTHKSHTHTLVHGSGVKVVDEGLFLPRRRVTHKSHTHTRSYMAATSRW